MIPPGDISRFRIVSYFSADDYVSRSFNENHKLTSKLFQHHENLGVVAYEADFYNPETTVKWELDGKWYSTAQIEQIMELRAFL
jgi:hypothetical protein